MKSALIGHTGFVGSNLDAQHRFSSRYHSKNIREIEGQAFDLVVIAAPQAKKWWANQNPQEDWAQIDGLLGSLQKVRATKVVLLGTVDVYPSPRGVDETTPIPETADNPYGLHRFRFEKALQSLFPQASLVIRLPGLFGTGLKKNVIFDLIHDNLLEQINPASRFQYYFLDRLWRDIGRCLDAGLGVVNFATEPIETARLIERLFAGKPVGSRPNPAANYDFKTIHDGALGGSCGYLYSSETVLRDLETYLKREMP